MSLEELMKRFAELVGRNLARRWLKARGLASPQGDDPPPERPMPSEADGAPRGREAGPRTRIDPED